MRGEKKSACSTITRTLILPGVSVIQESDKQCSSLHTMAHAVHTYAHMRTLNKTNLLKNYCHEYKKR